MSTVAARPGEAAAGRHADRYATTDMRVVTAAEISDFRGLLRTAIEARAAAGTPKASPVHPFLLSSNTYEQLVGQLTPAEGPRPTAVHLGQQLWLRGLVKPGERVAIDLEVLAARREPRGVRLAIRCVLVGGDGATLSELRTAVLLVGATEPAAFGVMPVAVVRDAEPDPGPVESTAVTCVVTRETVDRFAATTGERNPVHSDDGAAVAAGFPGRVVQGMCLVALIVEDVIDRFAGGDAERIAGVGARFTAPAFPDETLEILYTTTESGPLVGFTCASVRGPVVKGGWVRITAEGGESDDNHDHHDSGTAA